MDKLGRQTLISGGFVFALLMLVLSNTGSWLGANLFENRPLSLLSLTLSIVFSTGILLWLVNRWKKSSILARLYLDRLCQLDERDSAATIAVEELPSLEQCTLWEGILNRVKQTFESKNARMIELEQSRAAAEIRNQRNSNQFDQIWSILRGLPEPLVVVDGQDRLLLVNRQAEQLFGIQAGETEKRAMDQVLHCEQLIQMLEDTTRHPRPAGKTADVEIPDSDGQKHWFQVTASTLGGTQVGGDVGLGQGAVAILRDIHQLKSQQKQNADFVSSVSHEMKTPLAGIKAYVEMLVDGDAEDEETQEKFLQVINSQADRLQRLIDNLLNLARIEAGVIQVEKKNQSLNEILQEAIRVLKPSAEAKSIELTSELSPMYLGVLVDHDLILQVAINLLSNAIKYTPSGGHVTVSSRMGDAQVEFEVRDTGVGLSEEDCDKVFEKFYRVKKDKEMASGTGLGLPLAKHITEDVHGGKLVLKSKLGAGSTFTVKLPEVGKKE